MAIAYDGINYFPVGVNFMEENAMEVIEAKYGIKGSAIVLKLMCKIYKEGYYIRWDEEQCLIFANKAGREVQAEEVQGIIEILFTKGILDRNSYQENGILTSESIQKRYEQENNCNGISSGGWTFCRTGRTGSAYIRRDGTADGQ